MLEGDFKCSFEANFTSSGADAFLAQVMSCHSLMMITDQWLLAVARPNT
jgi:hypothetical protein